MGTEHGEVGRLGGVIRALRDPSGSNIARIVEDAGDPIRVVSSQIPGIIRALGQPKSK